MEIRRINYDDSSHVAIGDFITGCHETKEYEVTEIRPANQMYGSGYAVMNNETHLSFIPYHTVTMIFWEVENES